MAVVLLDSMRADMVDEPEVLAELPTLRRLFKESFVFDRAFAPSHWTLPTHASLFTGFPPREHGAHPPSMKLPGLFLDLPNPRKMARYKVSGERRENEFK